MSDGQDLIGDGQDLLGELARAERASTAHSYHRCKCTVCGERKNFATYFTLNVVDNIFHCFSVYIMMNI